MTCEFTPEDMASFEKLLRTYEPSERITASVAVGDGAQSN